MNKKNFIRFLTLMLALLMSLSAFVACKNGPETPKDTGNSVTTAGGTDGGSESGTGDEELDFNAIEKEVYRPELLNWGEKDGPYEYRWMIYSGHDYCFYNDENEELEGDPVNTALADRAAFIEENLNIAFVSLPYAGDSQVTVRCNSGSDFCDALLTTPGVILSNMAKSGHAMDLAQAEELNLEASYWDQRIQQDYAINGRILCLQGDFTVWDDLRTQVILFNSSLYENYGYKQKYGSPYTMVSNNKWTFDTMLEMYQGTSQNKDTDPALGRADTWGMLSELLAPYLLFLGSGEKTVKNIDGQVTLLFEDNYASTYDIIEDIMKRFGMDDEVMFVGGFNDVTDKSDQWGDVSAMFEARQALFRSTTLSAATRLRDMADDFGVLPIPMYNEDVGTYYSWCSDGTPICVPITVKQANNDMRALSILEAICYYSRYTESGQSLYEAFFENMTYVKLCRNEEDRQMLTLIFNTKTYDLDHMLKITTVSTTLSNMVAVGKMDSLSSDLSGSKSSASSNLEDYLTAVEKKYQ